MCPGFQLKFFAFVIPVHRERPDSADNPYEYSPLIQRQGPNAAVKTPHAYAAGLEYLSDIRISPLRHCSGNPTSGGKAIKRALWPNTD